MKTTKVNKIKFYDQLFNQEIEVIYNCSLDKAKEYYYKQYGRNILASEGSSGFCLYIDDCDCGYSHHVIWLEDMNDRFTIMVHEALHLTFNLLNSAGIKHCKATEEVFTYYQQYIIETILEKIKKVSKKKKK